jgi:four helix bundle protein
MRIDRFEDIIAWQLGRELFKNIYPLVEVSKDYWFRDQIRRASLSITNNIAEGFGRYGNKEMIRYLKISKGSCLEVRSMLYSAVDINLIKSKEEFDKLFDLTVRIEKLLVSFIKSLEKLPNY